MKLHKLPLLIIIFITQSNMGMEISYWHILTPEIIIHIATLIDNKASFAMVNKQNATFIQQHTLLQQYPRCLNSKDHMNFMVKYAKKNNHGMINLGLKTSLLCGYDYLKMFSSFIPSEDQLHMTITTYKVQCNYESNPKLPTELIKPLISFLKGDINYIKAYKERLKLNYEINRDRFTPLHVAVNLCDINFASLFLAQNPTLLNQLPSLSGDTNLKILTPFAVAIYRKDHTMCKFLLSFKNIELDLLSDGYSLLEYSAINSNFEILKLIAHALKQKYDHKKYISFFTESLLINKISYEEERLFLLNEINYRLPGKTQPLHIAINSQLPTTAIDNIVNHPATNINAQDEEGNTPLLLAIHKNYGIDCINFFLEKGADPTIKNKNLQTVLHMAYANDLMNRLLKTDALNCINFQDKNGYTPLLCCIFHRHESNLEILLKAGANPDIPEQATKKTPLLHAICFNYTQKAKLLLKYGANLDKKDIYNKTAYDYAHENNYEPIQELLDNYKKHKKDLLI